MLPYHATMATPISVRMLRSYHILSFAALEFRGAADLNSRNHRSDESISSLVLSYFPSAGSILQPWNSAKNCEELGNNIQFLIPHRIRENVWSPCFHLCFQFLGPHRIRERVWSCLLLPLFGFQLKTRLEALVL